MKRALVLMVLALMFAGAPCTATDTWEDVIPGVRHLHRVTTTPWDIHVLIIDLTNPRIKIRAGIKNDNDKPDGGETVRSECIRYNAVAGINCDYFAFTSDGYHDRRHCPQGYAMTDGLNMLPPGAISPIVSDRTAIAIPDDSSYAIINKFMTPGSWWWNVVAGGPRLIRNGVVGWEFEADLPDQTSRQPRTGAAISKDWHTLIFATVDGRQADSAGMTANELGALLAEFGGYQGMAFDSGGSTTTVINGMTVNHPSDGSDRPVADCLMVIDELRQGSSPIVYFESDFEEPAYGTGDLGGSWSGNAHVADGGRGAGQCARFCGSGSQVNITSAPVRGVQWVECYVKCSSTSSNGVIYAGSAGLSGAAAVVKFAPGGQIIASDKDTAGGGVWTNIGSYTANAWYRIGLRLDYNIYSYQLFLNGKLMLSGAAFKDPVYSGLQAIKYEETTGASDFLVDDIYAGSVDPDFVRVSPDALVMVQGARKQFSAIGGDAPVSWSVVDERNSDGSAASPGSIAKISQAGVLTALSAGYCGVQAQDSIGRVDKNAGITIKPRQSIFDIKSLADGASVNTSRLMVTAAFNGCIYAQDPDRASGIKIITSRAIPEGSEIWLTGTLDSTAGERAIEADWLEVSP